MPESVAKSWPRAGGPGARLLPCVGKGIQQDKPRTCRYALTQTVSVRTDMKCRTPISVGELAFVGVEKNLSENTEIRRDKGKLHQKLIRSIFIRV